jgi:hypothetical protein
MISPNSKIIISFLLLATSTLSLPVSTMGKLALGSLLQSPGNPFLVQPRTHNIPQPQQTSTNLLHSTEENPASVDEFFTTTFKNIKDPLVKKFLENPNFRSAVVASVRTTIEEMMNDKEGGEGFVDDEIDRLFLGMKILESVLNDLVLKDIELDDKGFQ